MLPHRIEEYFDHRLWSRFIYYIGSRECSDADHEADGGEGAKCNVWPASRSTHGRSRVRYDIQVGFPHQDGHLGNHKAAYKGDGAAWGGASLYTLLIFLCSGRIWPHRILDKKMTSMKGCWSIGPSIFGTSRQLTRTRAGVSIPHNARRPSLGTHSETAAPA